MQDQITNHKFSFLPAFLSMCSVVCDYEVLSAVKKLQDIWLLILLLAICMHIYRHS